uniref:hypothetical protein n=1 Tax=Castellaniella defragrans TaxID=75697 RepID=UPI0033403061
MSENTALLALNTVPLMTPAAYAKVAGIEFSVFQAQMYRGYWPTTKVGKRVFVNVEAVRLQAAQEYLDKYSV